MIERPWSDAGFEALATIVAALTGLVFPPGRRLAVERGMREAMQRTRAADLDDYAALVARDSGALDDLVGELTVDETYFFREPRHFDFVREVIVPEVLERRGPRHAVRAWSAGCATGEEAYSLAILLDDARLPAPPYILATDISRASLQTARAGIYREWSFRGVPSTTIERCFHRLPGGYALAARFRNQVALGYLNFALDPYPALDTGTWGMDVIFCRNVLIYLDRPTVALVAERLRRCLAGGGWIITASSDPMLSDYTDLEPTITRWGIFYRRGPAPSLLVARPETKLNPVAVPARIETPPPPLVPPPAAPEAVVAEPDPAASASLVRALANVEVAEAERACVAALERHPLSVELHFLHCVLLIALARPDDAIRAARRMVYLDGACEIGHFMLGGLLRRTGDLAGARRGYRNAHDLLAAQPADALVSLSDGEQAGRMAEIAAIELDMLSALPSRVLQ